MAKDHDGTGEQTALGEVLVSEEAVYGLILVAGMIVVSSHLASDSWQALVTVLGTVVVFFVAHVYAGTVSRLAAGGRLRASLRASAKHSAGMLAVAVIPLVILGFGASGMMGDDEAATAALVADVVLLAVAGWLMVAAHTRVLWLRVCGALVTAAFGGLMILLKVVIHV